MFRRMDETNQTLETQIQSSYVQHWPLGVRGLATVIDTWVLNIWSIYCLGVMFAYYWLVSIKSNIFIRSTLCFNLLCSTTFHIDTLRARTADVRKASQMKSSSSYCSYCCHVPCLFPVPFQCLFPVPFHGLCAPASDFCHVTHFFC